MPRIQKPLVTPVVPMVPKALPIVAPGPNTNQALRQFVTKPVIKPPSPAPVGSRVAPVSKLLKSKKPKSYL